MARSCASAKQGFRRVSHVLFDMDGLLLDTEVLYTQATTNIVAQYGKTYNWEIKIELMGLTGEDSAKRIVEIMDLPITWQEYYAQANEQYALLMPNAKLMPVYTPQVRAKLLGTQMADSSKIAVNEMQLPISWEEFMEKFRNQSDKLLNNCPLMPGAERLVKHLHKESVPMAVATSSSKVSYDHKIQNHKDFFNLFHHVVTGGSDTEVKSGKPSPDIFLVCASRFPEKPPPENCLVFEDAPNGVTAANSAGMQSVMVPEDYIPQERTTHASLVLKSLNELKPELFGLPGFKGAASSAKSN